MNTIIYQTEKMNVKYNIKFVQQKKQSWLVLFIVICRYTLLSYSSVLISVSVSYISHVPNNFMVAIQFIVENNNYVL